MDLSTLFLRFGAALAIGFLVGLERQHSMDTETGSKQDREFFGGTRTFSLLGLTGALAAMSAELLGSPLIFIGIVMLAGLLIIAGYYADTMRGNIGATSEISAMVVIFTGALAYWDQLALAAAVGVATTVLLSLKLETQLLVRRITEADVYATLKFMVVTAIVLPVLPNQNYGFPPLDVLNPYKIWLMVVLISGISFLGYLLMKILSADQSIPLSGFLGGLVSSTAVTLSFTQRSKSEPELARTFALAIIVAWTVMFGRVLATVAIVNIDLLKSLWIPMAASMAAGLVYCGYLFYSQRSDKTGEITLSNPFELGPAIKFGLIYAAILLVAKAAQVYFGDGGTLFSSLVVGVADVDAITLSMAELSKSGGGLGTAIAAQAVVLATVSNTITKGGIVLTTGSPTLRRALLPGMVFMLVVAVSVAFLFV